MGRVLDGDVMNSDIDRLKSRIASRKARHEQTADLERELIFAVIKQIRREVRDQKRKENAA
jgi:hypothetical protein